MIDFTPEGAVVISYNTLSSSPASLTPAIETAFGSEPSSLGIIIVRDLPPEYNDRRKRLMELAFHFGYLDENIRERYSDPLSKYSFGWSHGKEIMNGKPDILKGSYYANPIVENAVAPPEEKERFPEYYGQNIWPKTEEPGLEDFEHAFKALSQLIFKVGCDLAEACQPFASLHLNSAVSLADMIRNSNTTKGRLLHYFPPSIQLSTSVEEDAIDSWCGFHRDHSLLTGLCSAMFLRPSESNTPKQVDNPSPTSGLYIRTRGNQLIKITIPQDSLAFQTGEALEIATNGRLLATPHCVRVGSFSVNDRISRESFALFMQPNTTQFLTESMTFGQFSKEAFQEHY